MAVQGHWKQTGLTGLQQAVLSLVANKAKRKFQKGCLNETLNPKKNNVEGYSEVFKKIKAKNAW
jgi:hypothetical protein